LIEVDMRRSLVVTSCFLACLAADAVAQTSSGRHRAPAEEAAVEPTATASAWHWSVSTGAGMATSGDVLRIRTEGASGIPWAPPGGQQFASPDVRLTLDEGIALAVGVGKRLSSRWWARVDVSASAIDLAAEARIGEVMDDFLWDRFNLLTASVGLEYRLTDLESFPYLTGGLGVVSVSDDGDGQFDQTRPAFRFGAGYQQALVGNWALRLEARDAVSTLDLADYVPPVAGNLTPNFEVEELNPLHVVELVAVLTGYF
jgi:opacity protein-like surface antigen